MNKIDHHFDLTNTQWERHLLCSLFHYLGELPPHWLCLSLPLCLLMIWAVQICKELMGRCEKIDSFYDLTKTQWVCIPSMQSYPLVRWNPPFWQGLSLRLCLLMMQTVLIHKEQIREMWEKLTIFLISQIIKEHACLFCSLIHQKGEILPLWWCLSLQLCLLMMPTVQIHKEWMQKMWKNLQLP